MPENAAVNVESQRQQHSDTAWHVPEGYDPRNYCRGCQSEVRAFF